jgi:hypothetical protein
MASALGGTNALNVPKRVETGSGHANLFILRATDGDSARLTGMKKAEGG